MELYQLAQDYLAVLSGSIENPEWDPSKEKKTPYGVYRFNPHMVMSLVSELLNRYDPFVIESGYYTPMFLDKTEDIRKRDYNRLIDALHQVSEQFGFEPTMRHTILKFL